MREEAERGAGRDADDGISLLSADFSCTISFRLLDSQKEKCYYYSHLTDEETNIQRSYMAFQRPYKANQQLSDSKLRSLS